MSAAGELIDGPPQYGTVLAMRYFIPVFSHEISEFLDTEEEDD